MDAELKSILFEIVRDLADLRANQAVLVARVGTGTTIADARDAKTAAMREQGAAYAKLRGRIESL
jgi:hypothetical protein